MRRLSLAVSLTAVLLLAGVLPAGAAPSNSKGAEEIVLACDEVGEITVLAQFNSSGVALFDLEGNGRQYLLSYAQGRFYEGDLEVEPDGDPDFMWEKTWGKRKGYSVFHECEAGPFFDGSGTAFFDVVIAGK